ncbi:aminotransferase class V-fold PLP-dependent enzyme [Dinghuibacter silviterrae]|uniref:Selenocysteine lyase/cysteine desulfurase n=1 Tax=Dinghuibacter silviterrae TaxID=1539049 RepID=A0A4R8DFT6_9BACT|nr:aminotransferase class V-fold PLP-dependent enzyme [Dinghuibacter silviterrae]TDW96307.1 selenocysteine lyase/cysteine desulfurase [Dinghuibacter silviterrae]
MHKRTFVKGMALGLPLTGDALSRWVSRFEHRTPEALASEEDFWKGIRVDYRLTPDYINLENGYYNIIPEETLEALVRHIRDINYQGSHYMRTVQFDNKRAMAERVANLTGCSPEELVITRNTTESLDMIIGGIHWQAGDEAVMAEQDYGSMLRMFRQVADRYGVVNKIVSVPNLPASDDEIVSLYANALTPKTRLLMVSHMINITGQILPVRKICDMARARGVAVMVDGAHTVAHLKFAIPDLGCDYFGSSLHKWLAAPLGTGLLYVRKDRIPGVWPLLPEPDPTITGIGTLNHTGTLPVYTDLSVGAAIDYYLRLGADRKEARLRYLQQYWTVKVRNLPGVEVNTPADPARACGIANVGIKGMKPADLADTLMKRYKIYTVAIDGAGVHGCRITPNVFTLPSELDVLVAALSELGARAV